MDLTAADQPSPTRVSRDPWATTIIAVIAIAVIAGAPVFADVVEGSALIATRTILCAACIVVAVRRLDVLTGGELWILLNLAVLYNPIVPFALYERDRWFWLQLATGIALGLILHRVERPSRKWGAGIIGFIVGVYTASVLAESIVVGQVDRSHHAVLALPVSLAAATFLLVLAATLLGGAILVVCEQVVRLLSKGRH